MSTVVKLKVVLPFPINCFPKKIVKKLASASKTNASYEGICVEF